MKGLSKAEANSQAAGIHQHNPPAVRIFDCNPMLAPVGILRRNRRIAERHEASGYHGNCRGIRHIEHEQVIAARRTAGASRDRVG